MKRDEFGFKLLADKYESSFRDNMWEILKKKKFHIEQLETVIGAADEILEVIDGELENWCNTIKEVYTVDDEDNLWLKFKVFLMKKYVNYHYEKLLKECYSIGDSKEKLQEFLRILDPNNKLL